LSVLFITALGMILNSTGRSVRGGSFPAWVGVEFAGALIATLFWVSG